MKKIRCAECGNIIAMEVEPITEGRISIMCPHKKPNGGRCKAVNYLPQEKKETFSEFVANRFERGV